MSITGFRRAAFWAMVGLLPALMGCKQVALAQALKPLDRVEPPHWYVGMADDELQLLLYGKDISGYTLKIDHPGVRISRLERVENPNYLFAYLRLSDELQAGEISLLLEQGRKRIRQNYTIKPRRFPDNRVDGFSAADLVYLIMPDRFANGDPTNDVVKGMQQATVDRTDDRMRHGGDLRGIEQHLDYIADLGVTALWLNPVQENNQPRESYHGYAMTDLYKIDPRLGTDADYLSLVEKSRDKGMKMIMDLVHNHVGDQHWFIRDMPSADWVNQWPAFTRTTYRAMTQMDPYAAEADARLMRKGWFDTHMPDLNQKNPHLAKYLIQNNIWWVEHAGLSGFRLDTYAYPDEDFMNRCLKAIRTQYPDIGIVGEVWVHTVAESAYWVQGNRLNPRPQQMPGVTDFPLYGAIRDGLNEGFDWDSGLRRIYYTLGQDMLYGDASRNMIFLDNHDISRAWAIFKQNMAHMKMAHAMLLTMRGIPQLYYGSELLFGNYANMGGTNVRQNMPGGWPGDSVSKFSREGRNAQENELVDYLSKLGQWRKSSKAIAEGGFRHYVPEDEVYVYFRMKDEALVMVLVNSATSPKKVATARFEAELQGVKSGRDVMSGAAWEAATEIEVPAKSVRILDLRK
ncbi:MAG: glycoside hydrolase family 13 protein [Bacteroidia bacterium]